MAHLRASVWNRLKPEEQAQLDGVTGRQMSKCATDVHVQAGKASRVHLEGFDGYTGTELPPIIAPA